MNILGLVDKKNIFLLLGCYCNNPKLIISDKYETNANDYNERFHKMIYGAIHNIAKKSNINKITSLEIENELSQFPEALNLWKVNEGRLYIEKAIEETEDKALNIDLYRDTVRKYSILRTAVDKLKIDISFIYDEEDEHKLELFTGMTSEQVLGLILNRFNDFKSTWKSLNEDNYSFHPGDKIKERLQTHKEQNASFGYPFQSGYMTTVFRGMRPKKFIIRSSVSGGGKSRSSLAEACNIASDKLYDWTNKKWVSTGEKKPVLFISTELTDEEIQDILLAHISGIDEDRIVEWKDITHEEELILNESSEIVKNSLLYGEYLPDFTIVSIEETIEKYVIDQDITHAFFDYINDSPSLYAYYIEKAKVKLQTHQILFLFSAALKKLANKYNIYLGSSTQLSSNWKDERDANAVKGSKAIIEKADGGILAIPVSSSDLNKLSPILNDGFYKKPTMGYYIYKNRGGKWKSIIVWTRLNLGTVRETDCFVTTADFELIRDIEKTLVEFQIDDVSEFATIEIESSTNEYIEQFNNIKIDD